MLHVGILTLQALPLIKEGHSGPPWHAALVGGHHLCTSLLCPRQRPGPFSKTYPAKSEFGFYCMLQPLLHAVFGILS